MSFSFYYKSFPVRVAGYVESPKPEPKRRKRKIRRAYKIERRQAVQIDFRDLARSLLEERQAQELQRALDLEKARFAKHKEERERESALRRRIEEYKRRLERVEREKRRAIEAKEKEVARKKKVVKAKRRAKKLFLLLRYYFHE